MDSATIFKVAHHRYMRTVDNLSHTREFALDGVEVEQRLARMFAGTIAGIDHRNVGRAHEFGDRAFLRMSHDERIGITADHAAGVVDRLAFCHR